MTQLRKNVLWMGGLGALALGLGLFAYFGVAKPEEREKERKDVDEKLFAAYRPGERASDGGAPPDVVFTSLVVTAKGETTALEKKEGAWQIVQPVHAPADPYAVDQLVNALQTAKFKDRVEESPTDADLAKYGLKEPKLVVKGYAYAPDKDGKGEDEPSRKREVALYGGIENSFDGSFYVRREGEKAIHSVEGGTRYSLEKTTFDLRNKEVLGFEEPKLMRIAVKTKANAYELERQADHAWHVVKPIQELADTNAVNDLLNGLRSQRANAFPADSADARKKAGLDAPQVDATFSFESGPPARVRIAKADKVLALVERGDDATLAEVPEGALAELDKNGQDLRDKSVLTFNRDAVAKVSVRKAGGPEVVAEKEATDAGIEDWRVTAPEKGPAKKWKLSSVLWNLSSLKATAFGEASPKNWAKYGLDKPERSVTLYDGSGKALARLEIGKPVDGKPTQLSVRGSKDIVLQVEASRMTELPTTLDDLLDKPAPEAADGGATALKN